MKPKQMRSMYQLIFGRDIFARYFAKSSLPLTIYLNMACNQKLKVSAPWQLLPSEEGLAASGTYPVTCDISCGPQETSHIMSTLVDKSLGSQAGLQMLGTPFQYCSCRHSYSSSALGICNAYPTVGEVYTSASTPMQQ